MADSRIQDALAQLARIEAHLIDHPDSPLNDISTVMVEDARRVLQGDLDWPSQRLERLLDRVLSGRFGASMLGESE